MKKRFCFAAAIAAVVFIACTEDEYLIENGAQQSASGEITFACKSEALTRATNVSGKDTAAAELGYNFVVVGYKTVSSTQSIVFDHYNVNYSEGSTSESNTQGWEYVEQSTAIHGVSDNGTLKVGSNKGDNQTIKYWDYSASQYDFFAFSMGANTNYATPKVEVNNSDNKTGLESLTYTFTGTADQLGTLFYSDVNTVTKSKENYKNVVTLNFHHVSPRVRIGIYDAVPGYKITGVKFYNSKTGTNEDGTPATTEEAYLYTSAGYFYNSTTSSTYTLTLNNSNGNITPSVSISNKTTEQGSDTYDTDQVFSKLNYTVTKNDVEYLSETSSTSTKTDYQYVFPTRTDQTTPLNLKVDYTLVSDDGSGEVINVKGATAVVPATYSNWKQGYAYTYIFKISQNTNGSTGTPGTDETGLYPIIFDACVTGYDIEETITTVSDPSITTHGILGDSVVYGKDEYVGGSTIAATVMKGTTQATLTTNTTPNIALYTATLTKRADKDAANKPSTVINESTVAQVLAQTSAASAPATRADNAAKQLTDKNGWILTVTDVTSSSNATVTDNALTWKSSVDETYYVVEYTYSATENSQSVTKKAYKVIHVTGSITTTVTESSSSSTEVTMNADGTYTAGSVISMTFDKSYPCQETKLYYYENSSWTEISSSTDGATADKPTISDSGHTITWTSSTDSRIYKVTYKLNESTTLEKIISVKKQQS